MNNRSLGVVFNAYRSGILGMFTRLVGLALLTISLCAISTNPAYAEEDVCMWRGKAPFCSGKCPNGWTSKERDKQGPANSKKCATGTKVRCCLETVEEVFGKAPLCAGKCPPGWTRQGDSDVGENGKKCTTGKAAVCSKDVN